MTESNLDFKKYLDLAFEQKGITQYTSSNYNDILIDWDEFVTSCEEGYLHDKWTYDNDLYCRNVIQIIIDLQLADFDEYQKFIGEAHRIDERFKKILLTDQFRLDQDFWWEKGILQYAYEQYVKNIKELYGVQVKDITLKFPPGVGALF